MTSQNFLTSFHNSFQALEQGVTDVTRDQRRWQTNQRREVREMRRLISEMNKNGAPGSGTDRIQATEQTILNHFITVRNGVERARTAFRAVQQHNNAIH